MKVLQVASSMDKDWGGIERYVCYLTEGLRSLGIQAEVACPANSRISQHLGGTTTDVRLRHRLDIRAAASFLRLFKTNRFDLVVTHFSPDYFIPAWAANVTGQRCVMTRHLAIPFRPARVKQYLKHYSHFIGVSNAVGESLIESAIPASRVSSTLLGVPPLVDSPSTNKSEVTDIGIFARLVKEKGQEFAIQAVEPPFHLHIYGEGPDKERLLKMAEGRPVTFHGYTDDVALAMSAMDCICMPSVWAEAASIAAFEAMSVGKPIVASRVGGFPEIIRDGSTGILVQPEDPSALLGAWKRLRSQPTEAQRLAQDARKDYENEFTVDAGARRVAKIYEDCIAARTRAT